MHPGALIGIAGAVIGILGGAAGTYFSIRNTNGPRERFFMVRVAVVGWIAISTFLVALFVVPVPYNQLVWIPYVVALPLAIRWGNRRQAEIRAAEEEARRAGDELGVAAR